MTQSSIDWNFLQREDLEAQSLYQTAQCLNAIEVDMFVNSYGGGNFSSLKLSQCFRIYVLRDFKKQITARLNQLPNATSHLKRFTHMFQHMGELDVPVGCQCRFI